MRDVAVRAGVGLGTVSRVVNGAGAVRDETASRVRAAIDELGFQRDEIARALRPGQNSSTIGLVLGDLTNPFYASIAKAAVDAAGRLGYAVVLGTVDEDPAVERRTVRELIGRRVAGLIVVPDQSDHSYLADADHVPVVFVDRPATGVVADAVLVDNERGGRLATTHLVRHGHRHTAVLVAPSYHTTGRRLRGYRRALHDAGLAVDERLVVRLRDGTADEAAAAVGRLLREPDPPTAVFATTNFLAEGVLRATRRARRRLALVGFDDFRFADMLPTPVTVVTADVDELGRRAASLLLARLTGDASPPRRVVLPVRLVERGSGELPPRS